MFDYQKLPIVSTLSIKDVCLQLCILLLLLFLINNMVFILINNHSHHSFSSVCSMPGVVCRIYGVNQQDTHGHSHL